MIQQRPRIIVGDARFEPGTCAQEVWRAANEPPHLQLIILSVQCAVHTEAMTQANKNT